MLFRRTGRASGAGSTTPLACNPATSRRSCRRNSSAGELAVLRTYPVRREEYVGGAPTFLPQPAGLDSPVLYLRFVVLTGVFSAVMLAVMTLLSATVKSNRRGLVLAIVLLLVLVVGIDLAAIIGLTSGLGEGSAMLAIVSPNSAYRALVMAFVVNPVTTTPLAPVAPLASSIVLLFWLVSALSVATWQVWTKI